MWITLNPQAGHEQSGRRPALVLSPISYNDKTGLAILMEPILGMEFLGSVEADANYEIMIFKKPAPIGCEECAVGLNSVDDPGIWGCMFLLKLNNTLKKLHSGQCWFTSMPGKEDIRSFGYSDMLPDICFKHFALHSKTWLFRVDPLLI